MAAYKYGSTEHKKVLINNARNRARSTGLPCTLSVSDINIPDVCPVLGIDLTAADGSGGRPNSATLDRLSPTRGYVPGNIAVISMKANRMKSDCWPEDIMRVGIWFAHRLGIMGESRGAL